MLAQSKLDHAFLWRVDMSRATLRGASLRNMNFREAKLSNADLRYADLTDASCTGVVHSTSGRAKVVLQADLTSARLNNAKLNGADLSRARLGGADLTDAHADDKTKWPPKFDPAAAGVRFTNTPKE
jgi:uncharacterized protein YjbI with pentapeptide repeats